MEIKIPLVIRTALRHDLFGPGDNPIQNTIYFLKDASGKFIGPFRVHSEIDVQWFIGAFIFRSLYVLSFDEDGYLYQVALRPANHVDLVDGTLLRANQMFYIKSSTSEIDGPYYIHKDIDVDELRENFKSKKVYVVSESQSFEPFRLSKSA